MNAPAELQPNTPGLFDNPASLIYGIGNSGREDDGLGWAFIDRLECGDLRTRAHLRRTYQLNLEDADLISRYQRVLFVDATKDPLVDSFAVSRPEVKLDLSFTSHAMSVSSILATTRQCFDQVPDSYVLAIRGYQWELREGITRLALANLVRSVDFLTEALVHNPAHRTEAV